MNNKDKNSYIFNFSIVLLLLLVVFLESFRIFYFANEKKITYTQILQNQTEVSLYPGFLVKDMDGIFWHPTKPVFDQTQERWQRNNSISVTGCIFDPWPYTGGGSDCLMRLGEEFDTN